MILSNCSYEKAIDSEIVLNMNEFIVLNQKEKNKPHKKPETDHSEKANDIDLKTQKPTSHVFGLFYQTGPCGDRPYQFICWQTLV